MDSIPEEIWLLVFKIIQDGVSKAGRSPTDYHWARAASLRPLSATCRTLHRMCQPLLFETLVIQDDFNPITRSEPHLKSMVSKVYVQLKDDTSALWNKLETVLTELYSVREVSIWRAGISRALFDHFRQCFRLESLVLLNVSTTNSTETTPISLDSLKYLRYEPSRDLRATHSFPTLILPKLETLRIGSIFLSGSAGSFNHQVFQFNPSVLTELLIGTYSRADVKSKEASLVELLKRAHGLRSLSLERVPEFKSSLADDLIPELEAFRGSPENVLIFCKGRPVRKIDTELASTPQWILTDLEPNLVRPGSVSLEHLSIDWAPWEDDTMGYIARHCPRLVSLKIRATSINGPLSTRHPMPQLRRATFLSPRGSWFWSAYNSDRRAEDEVKVVEECREFWTQLEHLRLDSDYFWRYRGSEVERVQEEEEEWLEEQ